MLRSQPLTPLYLITLIIYAEYKVHYEHYIYIYIYTDIHKHIHIYIHTRYSIPLT
jgi:hypothetical protein